ncbi:DUF1707 domain-containing protein [Arachnia propionica]|uniref:DUF1707 domain-containing protein n=1 Tax=Arachnia propionica TaxID=1750 RepID=A0A3P1WVS3_9ACTN|nr:DUF1707 domain-containing protein [Arachnia propionica]RRD48473.1 DUF1707 domain-containing protein [Arachnia propionica]
MSNLHVSFKERDVYLDVLSQNYAEGRLTDEEFRLRQDRILAAVTHGECRDALQGLVVSRENPFVVPDDPPLPQPAARPHRSRRWLIAAAGFAGLAVIGMGALGMAPYASHSGPHVEIPDLPSVAGVDTIRPPASWEDWPRFANDLEAAGVSEVYRLTVEPGLVEGEVRYLDGSLWEIRTVDGALHSTAWLLGEENLGFSVYEVIGGQLIQRMTRLVEQTWPGTTRIERIDLRGAGEGSTVRVTFLEGERRRVALIDALTERIIDVHDG